MDGIVARLQNIKSNKNYFVTINPKKTPINYGVFSLKKEAPLNLPKFSHIFPYKKKE